MGLYEALLLIAALPTITGPGWCSGEVVSVTERWGSGPVFARQELAVVAAVGQLAALDCRILHLGDKSVSWVRSRDLQILTHAGAVFTADARVSAAVGGAGGSSRHSLHVARLRASDAGRYECQINTEPKMSLFFNLTVLDEPVPEVVVEVQGPRSVTAVPGAAVTLQCEARYEPPPRDLPLPPLDIHWLKDDQIINLQSSRGGGGGGVSLDTERWAARALSRLALAELRGGDAGRYRCVAAGRDDAVTLRLTDYTESQMEAMQRDQSAMVRAVADGASLQRPRLVLLLALLPIAVRVPRILNT
ncbi:protein amalgam [Aphomia sociella]